MESIITELDLNIKEIKYLLKMSSDEPDLSLIAIRRIKDMQNHLSELLTEIEKNYSPESQATENKIEQLIEIEHEYSVNIEPEPEVEIEADIMQIEQQYIEVEYAQENSYETLEITEVELPTYSTEYVLGEQLKPSADLIKSISLNDSFRFSRELFDGDTEKMNNLLQGITEMLTFNDVMNLLSEELNMQDENECLNDFVDLLKKYFA